MPGPQDLLRGLVSKRKKRYVEGEYDLDLSYIYPNLIAMGFPSENLQGVYRNHIDDVVKFLDEKHRDHYKVYNLCSERSYDVTRFHSRVAKFPFEDHNPPPIQLIKEFCDDVDSWLSKHTDNVAVIHCKAGKGRTGVMICSYMIHCGKARDDTEALEFYAKARTSDCKGVTIPSQKRYVSYYNKLRQSTEKYTEKTIFFKGMRFHTLPTYSNLTPQIVIHKCNTKIYQSVPGENVKKSERGLEIVLPERVPLCGDILVTVINRPKMMKKERIFQFWINTHFVTEYSVANNHTNGGPSDFHCQSDIPKQNSDKSIGKQRLRACQSCPFDISNCLVLRLRKDELDKANKDKTHKNFSPNFEVLCYFDRDSAAAVNEATGYPARNVLPMPLDSEVTLADLVDNLSDTESSSDENDFDETGRVSAV